MVLCEERAVNITKIIQMTAYLLKLNGGRLNYTKLLKLLYLSDRKSLQLYNYTISKDNYISMKYGPVLSRVYDSIKYASKDCGNGEYEEWNKYFQKDGYDLILRVKNDGSYYADDILIDDELYLSDANIEILEEIDKQYKTFDYRKLIEILHDKRKYPEVKWQHAERFNTSLPINLLDILRALGKNDDEIKMILDDNGLISSDEENADGIHI